MYCLNSVLTGQSWIQIPSIVSSNLHFPPSQHLPPLGAFLCSADLGFVLKLPDFLQKNLKILNRIIQMCSRIFQSSTREIRPKPFFWALYFYNFVDKFMEAHSSRLRRVGYVPLLLATTNFLKFTCKNWILKELIPQIFRDRNKIKGTFKCK